MNLKSKYFIMLTILVSFLVIPGLFAKKKKSKSNSESISVTTTLKSGVTWEIGKEYDTLSDKIKGTAKIEIIIKAGDKGIIMETGANRLGTVLYIFDGNLYLQSGSGTPFKADGQVLIKVKISKGSHLIEWSANAEKGKLALYLNGKLVGESSIKFEGLGGTNKGTIGGVAMGVSKNAGNFDESESGKFTGTIKSCTIWAGISLFD